MTVSNFQEFYNLIKNTSFPIVVELGSCINLLNRICTCKKAQRESKNEECNNLYINFIKNNEKSLVEELKLITQDNEVIFKHNTHYEIITLKIR